METADVYEDIRQIVGKHLDELCPEAGLGLDDNLWDLGMTSLKSVGIMLAVEENFDLELPDEVLSRETFSSVRSIGDVVSSLSGAGRG
jgi:acyl carrier protein